MSDRIIYPSLDLFLYDLKDGLGQDEARISQNSQNFARKVYGDLDDNSFGQKHAQIQQYVNIDAASIELLETRFQKFEPPLDGYYYPLQLGDTYALQVNYSGKLDANGKPNDDERDIDDKPFLNLKQEITRRISQQTGTIGQTWLVWGKLTEQKTDAEIKNIAQSCYSQIVSNHKWEKDLIGKGSLGDGTVFELWNCPEDLAVTGKEFWNKFGQENQHVLVWLFPTELSPEQMRQQVRTVYQDLMRLWQYRHKVVWAYYQSRSQKSLLKKEYIEIQPSILQASQLPKLVETDSLKLSQLQKTLTTNLINLSDYSIVLNRLDILRSTIEVNLENYKFRFAEMETKYPDSDLTFLKKFNESEIHAKKYQQQLAVDYSSFSPGLTLLQNLNSTIQGIIDLEQTKSDRNLNTTIALAGVGLATSQIASAVILAQPNDYKHHLGFRVEVFSWSLGIGAVATLLTLIVLRFLRR
ncbi:hypothetical protein C7B80_30090 [Cyanosarcina cf. burmensis CCALA 770]|nr:hypothetical protein C7B80_30090 [Cyanosarcina cf. burmensis CCALA 770]